nr:unnamed protein product [Callosobruchus chinensis]
MPSREGQFDSSQTRL